MLPHDYLRRLRHVELRARLISEQLMGGRLSSVFRGRGMDFADVREYVPGDDVRRIDWNVTARLRKPFIKRHVEERELVVLLLVDTSASGHFGTSDPDPGAATKRDLAAMLAGALAFSAIRQGDRIGLIQFSSRVERYVPPRKSRPHVSRLLHELLFHVPTQQGTSLSAALHFLNNVCHRPALVFVLSDFLDPETSSWRNSMRATHQRHEVMALHLMDPRELQLPDVGWAHLQDPETGEAMELNTSDPVVREGWRRAGLGRISELEQFCSRSRIPFLSMDTSRPWHQPLQRFLDQAAKRRVA
jgi:uncharacterized protein (DUF58 family)